MNNKNSPSPSIRKSGNPLLYAAGRGRTNAEESFQRLDKYLPHDWMRFRLTYEGPLVASGSNTSGRRSAKWEIRRQFHPQLKELWETHPVLKGIGFSLGGIVPPVGGRVMGGKVRIEQNERVRQQLLAPVVVGEKEFVPLVRESLKLACELNILFLRQGQPGSLILPGGDIDNRIKTLFDALKVPGPEDMKREELDDISQPFFCLLQDDALITGFDVETDRLLTRPHEPASQVFLVIDVNVRVMALTEANVGFLSE